METPLAVLRRYQPHNYSLAGALESRRLQLGHQTLLRDAAGDLSWNDFRDQTDALAAYLARQGVTHGDRVVVMGRTSRVHPLVLFALARLGAIMVPVNPDFTVDEAFYAFNHCEVSGIIAEDDSWEVARAAVARMTRAPWMLRAGTTAELAGFQEAISQASTLPVPP